MGQLTLNIAAASERGARTVHEDYVAADPELGLVVVADGTGGRFTGALAAWLAVEAIVDGVRSARSLGDAFVVANQLVVDAAASEGACLEGHSLAMRFDAERRDIVELARSGRATLKGMCAAVVAVRFAGDEVAVAHAGNCRAYRLARASITRLTIDHAIDLAKMGIQTHFTMPIQTRALGFAGTVADVADVHLAAGERLLLVSDGVHVPLDDEAIRSACASDDLAGAIDTLLARACARGTDNAAAALVERTGRPSLSCRNASVMPPRQHG
jgi:protein phosphatase